MDNPDTFDNPSEAFSVTLERAPGLNDNITLDSTNGLVIIIDTEGKCIW